ncbi:MAG: MlaD family protein [Myxococcota bacterium]|nr:MlaD family protein [Myxococcota bacterium]
MERDLSQDLKVGIFVFFSVFVLGLIMFVLGEGSELLEEQYKLNASFDDVGGLRDGAAVRLAGIDVGEVSVVRMSEDDGVKPIFVELTLKAEFQSRIREDSVARIDTEGVLGDKYVAISVGSNDTPELDDGAWLKVQESKALVEYQKQANEILAQLEEISQKVNLSLGEDDEARAASVANIISDVEQITSEAENGDGLIHALVYDKKLTRKLNHIATNLEGGSEDVAVMTKELREGDSIAHELLMGDGGEELATQLNETAKAMETLIADLENEDSVVHALLYDADKAQMVEDLQVTAANLRAVSEGIEDGDGTVGALLQDPELYYDLQALVGGAQRNKLLKYYVRKTVEEVEEEQASAFEE